MLRIGENMDNDRVANKETEQDESVKNVGAHKKLEPERQGTCTGNL